MSERRNQNTKVKVTVSWGASREFPAGPVVKILGFHSHSLGSIPDLGTESLKPSAMARKKIERWGPSKGRPRELTT